MRPVAHRWMRPDAARSQGATVVPDAKSDAELHGRRLAVATLRLEWELLKFALRGRKAGFNPGQPRDDHGRWTNGGGGIGRNPPREMVNEISNPSSQPRRQIAQLVDGVTSNSDPSALQLTSKIVTADARPVYDKVDAALLSPKGINATASTQRLEYHFDDDGLYLGGVTVTNEDRTVVGRMIDALNNSPVHISFEVQIRTANGISTSSFEIRQNLPPGASITIPWRDFGLMQGPGSVSILATNKGSFYTGVVVGAMRAPSAQGSR